MISRKYILMLVFYAVNIASLAQHVNYDEEKVGTYTLEDPLRFVNGKKVKNLRDWGLRRKEILDIFQREMYGQMPPKNEIYLGQLEEGVTLGGFGLRRQVRMWFCKDMTGPYVDWLIVTPRHAKVPVPSVLLLNYCGNHTVLTDSAIIVTKNLDVPHQLFRELKPRGIFADPNQDTYYPVSMILARGYAFITACYADISPDPTKEQETYAYQRCFELWPPRDPARDDNTTALGAWAWGLMRGMDMIEQDSLLDANRVVLTGSSRLGKAALIAGAFDERFPVVVPNQTGGGGAPLAKRNFGENIAAETTTKIHWYCKAYKKYAGHEDQMPFDQHLLLASVAPRALLVQGFNEPWFDTKGEFLSLQAASPVWEKFCRKGLPKVEWPVDYDTCAIGERLGYVRRSEKHGHSAWDWTWLMDFADNLFDRNNF